MPGHLCPPTRNRATFGVEEAYCYASLQTHRRHALIPNSFLVKTNPDQDDLAYNPQDDLAYAQDELSPTTQRAVFFFRKNFCLALKNHGYNGVLTFRCKNTTHTPKMLGVLKWVLGGWGPNPVCILLDTLFTAHIKIKIKIWQEQLSREVKKEMVFNMAGLGLPYPPQFGKKRLAREVRQLQRSLVCFSTNG